jgi:hypothetical protein
MQSGRKMMEIVEDPYAAGIKIHASKLKDGVDLYILCEGFKYTLREWRRWTHDEVVLDDGSTFTRGEYSMMFVKEISEMLEHNGYVLRHSLDGMARRFMHFWLQLYNSGGHNSRLPMQQHNGTWLELEKWDELFPFNFWEIVTRDFEVDLGFDHSYVGTELLKAIGYFFWTYIDVNKSLTIIDAREEACRIEEEIAKWSEDNDGIRVEIASKDKTDDDIRNVNNSNNDD